MNRLLVEFAGLPGAGKSTLASAVAEILEDLGFSLATDPRSPAVSLPTRLTYVRLLASRPAFVLGSVATIARTRPLTARDLRWATGTWLKRVARLVQASRKPGIHLFDPGVAQALWSIGARSRMAAFSQSAHVLLRRAPRPDLLAVIDAPNETLVSRLRRRPGSTSVLERDTLSPEAIARGRQRMDEVLGALGRLEAGPGVERFVNPDAAQPSATARRIVDWIDDRVDFAPREASE